MHMWKTASNFARPDMSIEGAHLKGTETGSIVFSVDGRTVLTRGGDDTVKCESYYDYYCSLLISLHSMGFTFFPQATCCSRKYHYTLSNDKCDFQS